MRSRSLLGPAEKSVERKCILVSREQKDHGEQGEPWNDMGMELVEWFLQEVPKGHEHQDATEKKQGRPGLEADEDEGTRDELDHRNQSSSEPQRPRGEEGVGVGIDEVVPRVADWRHRKALVDSGHKEDQPKNGATEKDGPSPVRGYLHWAIVPLIDGCG
jgi:hypothetical protein